jgi:23S rRNA (uracil-5-)-methyltransferase RumA
VQILIKKIVYPGRSLADTDGKVVFTDEGLPGEVVEVEPVREKASYIEARTVGIVEPSARRVEPRCGHFRACSPWQNMEYALQLEVKGGQVREIFSRELKIELDRLEVVPSPKIWGYRNRARFHVLRQDNGPFAAYHEPGSEAAFIRTERCELVPDEMNGLLGAVIGGIGKGDLRGVTDVEIRRSAADGRMLVSLCAGSGADLGAVRGVFGGLKDDFPLAGIVGLLNDRKNTSEVPLLGKGFVEENVAGTRFRIGARSFFQVNIEQLAVVAGEMRRIAAAAGEPRIADLYCGVGTFGILLAPGAKEVFGVESEEANIRFLKRNLTQNGVGNYAVCEGTSEEWIGEILDRNIDLVILDPPRKGVAPDLARALAEDPVRTLIYLSCNPATLARDLKILLGAYELAEVKVFDFFPHTPHIETLTILNRTYPLVTVQE